MPKVELRVSDVIAALDIGSSKVSALVAKVDGDNVVVIGSGLAPSRGMEKGVVADIAAVSESVGRAVEEAERSSRYGIDRAWVSIGGAHIQSQNSRGEAIVSQAMRGVEQADVDRALSEARVLALPQERQVLHVVPRGYWLDNSVLVREPIGMAAHRLDAEVHVVTALDSAARNLTRCVEGAGVAVEGLIAQVLAAGEAVLTPNEREMGVACVNIGAGTTDIGVYLNGSVWHTVTLGTGGNHITSDLAIGLHAPLEVAEDVKLRYGHCLTRQIQPDEIVRISGFGGDGAREFTREEVVRIIEARVEEICTLVQRELRRSSFDGLLSAGAVLCGGTANLPGIADLASEVMDMPVRVVAPRQVQGLTEVIGDVGQATGVGLLLWGARQRQTPDVEAGGGILHRLGRILRAILPG